LAVVFPDRAPLPNDSAAIAERELRKAGARFNPVGLYAIFLENPQIAQKLGLENVHISIDDSAKFGRANLKYLQNLPNLKELELGLNFPDEWCRDLERLTQLESLFFIGNFNFNVGLTDQGLASVAKLPNLKALSLLSTRITNNGLRHIKDLKQLRWLSLSGVGNIGNEGLVHLKDLKGLEDLSIEATHITAEGLIHLQEMTKLRRLRLPNELQKGKPGSMKYLAKMTELIMLDARGLCADDSDLKAVRGMTKLKDLNLCYTKVSDKGLEHLAGLTELEDLDLFGTEVRGEGLKHLRNLKKLRFLNLGFCDIQETALAHLREMHQLEYLEITTTNLDMKAIELLKRQLPKTSIR